MPITAVTFPPSYKFCMFAQFQSLRYEGLSCLRWRERIAN